MLERIARFIKDSRGLSLALTGVDSNAVFEDALSLPEIVEGFPPRPSDLLVVDSKGEDIGIDVVRAVEVFLTHSPEVSSRKYVVLRDIDRMTQQASNAFLKTLEEPPEYAVILTTTTMWYYLLPTMRSRLVRFNLPPKRTDLDDPWLRACSEIDLRVSRGEEVQIGSLEEALAKALEYEESPRAGCLAFRFILEEISRSENTVNLIDTISKGVSGKSAFSFLKNLARFSLVWMEIRGMYDLDSVRFFDSIARSKFSNFNTLLTIVNIIIRIREMLENGAEGHGVRG